MQTRKVVVVGESGVGKSNLVEKLRTGNFEEKFIATIGVEMHELNSSTILQRPTNFRFNVWDTAGSEKLGGMREGYYINANLAVIVIDYNSLKYKNEIIKWYEHVKTTIGITPTLIIFNKMEQEGDPRGIAAVMEQSLSNSNLPVRFLFTSLKTRDDSAKIVETMLELLQCNNPKL
jgi:small GTP-binding protein